MNPFFARVLVRLGLLGPDRLRVHVLGPDHGIPSRRVEAPLLVAMRNGRRREVTFRVDSACSISIISLHRARSLQLPTDGTPDTLPINTATGQVECEVLRGRLRFWLTEDQRAAPFIVPILFKIRFRRRPASGPPGPWVTPPKGVHPLLGLEGVIEQLRWTFDGRPRPDEPYGFCMLQDQRPAAQRYPS